MAENATISGASRIICTSNEFELMLEAENFSITGGSVVGIVEDHVMVDFIKEMKHEMQKAFAQRMDIILKAVET